jgi:hypothetical protein
MAEAAWRLGGRRIGNMNIRQAKCGDRKGKLAVFSKWRVKALRCGAVAGS